MDQGRVSRSDGGAQKILLVEKEWSAADRPWGSDKNLGVEKWGGAGFSLAVEKETGDCQNRPLCILSM